MNKYFDDLKNSIIACLNQLNKGRAFGKYLHLNMARVNGCSILEVTTPSGDSKSDKIIVKIEVFDGGDTPFASKLGIFSFSKKYRLDEFPKMKKEILDYLKKC